MTTTAYFDRKSQVGEVRKCIVQGALPVKYAYVGSGGLAHEKLTKTRGYKHVTGKGSDELRALTQVVAVEDIPEQIVEIGLGTGVHTLSFLQAIEQAGKPIQSFLGCDYSETLLDIGTPYLKKHLPATAQVTPYRWDVEVGPTGKIERWRRSRDPILVCTLGGTPVAFESSEPALAHLYRSLREDDLLLYSLLLRPEDATDEELLQPYQNTTFEAAIEEPLYAAGLTPEDFHMELSVRDNSITSEAVISRDVQLGDDLVTKGHKVRNFISHRFTQQEIDNLFAHTGWDVMQKERIDKSHVIVVARRKKDSTLPATIRNFMPASADWMAAMAPFSCTGSRVDTDSCSWYHGVWQYLRLFGMVSSPTWHDSFYQTSLVNALKGITHPNVLVSGTADYSMLAYVLEANARVQTSADIYVIDRCKTPIMACQWYADQIHEKITLHAIDLADVPLENERKYHLITTDAFLTRFDIDGALHTLNTWNTVLEKNGTIVTTVRVQANDSLTTTERVEDFLKRLQWSMEHHGEQLALPQEKILAMAKDYAERIRSSSFGSTAQISTLFEASGLIITNREIAHLKGTFSPSTYMRIVAKKTTRPSQRPMPDIPLINAVIDQHILPLKFAYTGSAAQKHLALAELDSYKSVTNAATPEALSLMVYDIGPGDGQHSKALLEQLYDESVGISYLGLDFSTELMAVAEGRIKTIPSVTDAAFRHWDVEIAPTKLIHEHRTAHGQPAIVTFLGQTLGNLEDPLQALKNIRMSVASTDRLMLSVALQVSGYSGQDYVAPYQNETFFEAILEPLRMVGIDTTTGKLSLTYEDDAVIGTFVLNKAQTIRHPLQSPKTLPKGAAIRCFISRRFKAANILTLLNASGWQLQQETYQADKTIGVYIATPKG